MPIKRLAWFVFKSPQRRMVGWSTLLTDLRGLAETVLAWPFPARKQSLVICTGTLNRSAHLLDILIPSLLRADNGSGRIALSVADCGSDDVTDLEAEIRRRWTGTLYFNRSEEPFTRSRSFNRAVKQSKEQLVMLCDADMQVPTDLLHKAARYVHAHCAWFPVCRMMLAAPPSEEWKYLSAGTGICVLRRAQFERVGGLDEKYTRWGHEDWDFFFRCYQRGIMPLRTLEYQLVHHFHPSLKPDDFTPMF